MDNAGKYSTIAGLAAVAGFFLALSGHPWLVFFCLLIAGSQAKRRW